MHKTALRSVMAAGMVLAAGIALTACSSSSSTTTSSSSSPAIGTNLSKVCPSTVTIQTDWDPEADHGQLYEMVGPNPTIDTKDKSVTGDLYSKGKPTGVKIQIRAGGPAIGYQTVSSELYKDKSITLGYISTDEAVQFSDKLPTTAVFAENNISPQIIMWDPATYPKVKTIAQLAKALKPGATVRYFAGAAYMAYLNGTGILPASETDGSYDGTPVKFAADKGLSGQQGFATAEPYIYSHEVTAWDKPVAFQLINDTGYPIYPEALSVRTGDLSKDSACLKKLVPVLQQADVDYFKSPAAANKLIVDLVTQYNDGWTYDANVANYAVKEMKKLKIASDGTNGYVGDLDSTRVAKVIKIDTPIFTATGDAPKAGLVPSDLFTNKFLDKSISLGF
jgi:hypothetical protein